HKWRVLRADARLAMPLSISMQCPHCGNSARTTQIVLPGIKVRCLRCRRVFQIIPSGGVLVETIPVARDRGISPTAELVRPRNRTKPAAAGAEATNRSRSGTNEPLPPRPAAPAPAPPRQLLTRGKPLPLTRGKPLPFQVSRRFTAVFL